MTRARIRYLGAVWQHELIKASRTDAGNMAAMPSVIGPVHRLRLAPVNFERNTLRQGSPEPELDGVFRYDGPKCVVDQDKTFLSIATCR